MLEFFGLKNVVKLFLNFDKCFLENRRFLCNFLIFVYFVSNVLQNVSPKHSY